MKDSDYYGYETGPIRPPSEADSLMLRITRNCPWNKCTFCGLYKGESFGVRPVEHIKHDIDELKLWTDYFRAKDAGFTPERPENNGSLLLHAADAWVYSGMRSVFLQDANSLVINPDRLIEILKYLRLNFPEIERITSYARSRTISGMSDEKLAATAAAGLNRIHIGLESGCDEILGLVKKGADKQTHITAGRKLKKAGIELSEYYIPGLGGQRLSDQNALETADALNNIDPDFIRIRTLAVSDTVPLAADYVNGVFTRTNDIRTAEELLLMIRNLDGITSCIKSDHIVNLLPEVTGRLPQDKNKMISVIETFLNLSEEDQMIFRIGRRTGIVNLLKDLEDPRKKQSVLEMMRAGGITRGNIDIICDNLIKRFI